MTDKVRYVGDPVAFVVAETLVQARDAAEAVTVDIDPLPAVTDAEEAAQPGAPQLYDHIPNNVALDYHFGDAEKVEAAFNERGACDQARHHQHPRCGGGDGAARGARLLRQDRPSALPFRFRPRASPAIAPVSPRIF